MKSKKFINEIIEYEKNYILEREEWEKQNDDDDEFIESESSIICFPLLGISFWDGLVWIDFFDDLHEVIENMGFDNGWDIQTFIESVKSSDIDFDLIAYETK